MSVNLKNMTELQRQIVEALANDFESIEQIRELVSPSTSAKQLKDSMWPLIKDGILDCHAPSGQDLAQVSTPDLNKLETYWFGLTERGEQILDALES